MKTLLIGTNLLTAGVFLGIGACYVDNASQCKAFAAGAVAGIDLAHLDSGLRRQGVTLTADEIKKIINQEWVKFNK